MEIYPYVFFILMCFLINDELTGSRYKPVICDRLVAARFSRTIWPIFFPFLIFYCYFTYLKAHEVSWQNMKSSENIATTNVQYLE